MGGNDSIMKKTILYRLFGFGSIPKTLRPVLEREGVVALDEGIRGWFLAKHVNGPGKRYRQRVEGFSACLAVTKARVVCYTCGKRQISIAVKDPGIANLYVDAPTENMLCLSFESSDFRKGWQGVIVLRFATEKALLFREALVAIGARQGDAAGAYKPRR
jgi:hypothetical protein